MDIEQLIDRTAAEAIAQATELKNHLRVVARGADRGPLDECEAEAHRLVAAVISLRNAAELLKRNVAADPSLPAA